MTTIYTLQLQRPEARLISVELRFPTRGARELDVRMPVWTPGSYLVREHQRHVDDLVAGGAGRALAAEKIDKHTWRIRCEGVEEVRVRYQLACFELTVRTNHVDATHAFLNPAATCLFVVGREAEACEVRLELPAGWLAWVALQQRGEAFVARDYDELVDSPFELGPAETHESRAFTVLGVPHELVVWGKGDLDLDKAAVDIAKIIESEAALFGGLPYREKYLFILHLNDKGRGGLEHRRSCALLAPRFSFQSSAGYEDFLQLVAHEFFHLWNVKRLRPAAFTPYDWTRENHTSLLWAMEGLTRAYEITALRRAGIASPQRALELWAELITTLLRTPGRLRSTLSQASYDAWIKFYRPDESTLNTTVSYYLKGGVVGLLLDLELRRRTAGKRSLDDLMRLLFERYGTGPGLPEDGVERAAIELAGDASLQAWFDRALRSTEELPLEEALAGVGLKAVLHPAEGADDKGSAEGNPDKAPKLTSARGWHGAALRDQGGVLGVPWVAEGSPAQLAGLGGGDEIVAVDGFRSEMKQRLNKSPPGTRLRLQLFRLDQLVELTLQLGAAPLDTVTLLPDPRATPEQLELRKAWLGDTWPRPDEAIAQSPSGR